MQAVVLFAHGSRDPLWHQPIQKVASRLQRRHPELMVRCAYLELTAPTLPEVVAELASIGATRLQIVPMFLGVGRHAREDLPGLVQDLQSEYSTLKLHLSPAVGEMDSVIEALVDAAVPVPDEAPHDHL